MGVSNRVGQLTSYWILPESGIPVSCTTLQRITNLEKQTDGYKSRMKEFDVKLEQIWAVQSSDLKGKIQEAPKPKLLCLEDEDEEFKEEFNRAIDNTNLKDVDATLNNVDTTNTTEFGNIDPYLGMKLGLNRGEEEGLEFASVKRRSVYEDGKPIGIPINNTILDSQQYKI